MTKDQFLQVNGFSNTYWGWGGEDDDLRIRWDSIFKIISVSFLSHLEQMWFKVLHSFTDTCGSAVLRRVELQKMKILRPPADVARYTMVFHKRDSGNEINKDRSVDVGMGIMW